jgi:hypothetical protein
MDGINRPEGTKDSNDAKPASVEAALEIAAKYSGGASVPSLHDEAWISQEDRPPTRREMGERILAQSYRDNLTVPSWSGKREDRPGSITLTPAQKEASRISGLSEVEYARQLIRLREEKAQGNYIGNGQ